MKKFEFKFETVIRVRKIHEESALRGVAAARRAYQLNIEEKVQKQEALAKAFIQREEIADFNSHRADFQIMDDFIQGTRHRILQIEMRILRSYKALEKAMRAFRDARRATMVVEKLKERAFAEHRDARRKAQIKEWDDQMVMRNGYIQTQFDGEDEAA
ncbi:MAG: hypothetical protein AAB425_06515 [Bdellovibrionota bacterium]